MVQISFGNMVSVRISFKLVFRIIFLCIIMPKFANISIKIYKTFRDSSVSFTLDTSYLNWNTTFPAVTLCEIYNGEKIWDISESYYGVDRDHRIDDFVADIVYFSGKCNSCRLCGELDCPQNFVNMLSTFKTPCERLISNCSWMGKPFECCMEFKPLQTEYGMCFSFNSIQTEPYLGLKFISNRQTGPGYVHFTVSEDVQVHVHPSNEIPYITTESTIRETILWGSSKEIILSIVEMINDVSVEGFSAEHRKCRFFKEIEESKNRLYKFYSFSSCIVECVKRAHLELCHCTSHFMSREVNGSSNKICNINGLRCLTENHMFFNQIRRDCECLSSCEEPEYNVIYVSGEDTDASTQSTVSVSILDLPTQRYIRNAIKTNLDLIISIGGIAGLFFGASILSIIEVLHVIFVKICTRIITWRKRYIDNRATVRPSKISTKNPKTARSFKTKKSWK